MGIPAASQNNITGMGIVRITPRGLKMATDDGDGTAWSIERAPMRGGSLVYILILTAVTIGSLILLYRTVSGGDRHLDALVLLSAFPAFFLALIAWEVRDFLPARLVISSDTARYYVNGRLRERITLGPEVKADVILDSDRIGPRPKAFHSSCAYEPVERPKGEFLLLCGISLTSGDRSISISHDDGWQLVDFNDLWDPFFSMVVEHDMEMGSDMWRYVEFRDTLQALGDEPDEDIFGMISAIEH